ncbi:MAG: MFS transporter [Lactobacillus mulieris]|uniref:MFS transporter n=1 Tax=Lactobacillus mulieris TaxID=2508708 RepID=A0AAP3M3Z8_9LACO|nr:MFS transporter [Lactobacillus mulieris]MCF1784111.1 MFS transporter [Lactobacillus mulieris]MCT7674307.1 MFS transporter [Lactobacillus mulieris]MCT7772527.1 MFS transporter [Lactobacillus mulieris]MCZ3844268.1 MFS transporter [Lactobacillus mulieris]MCZ3875929.1 MFS transporter [Lactobacillus mulieris]
MDVESVKQNNKQNWKLKVGILGISLFLQVAGSNLAAIPLIAKSFPNQSITSIQALFTIPSFTIMLFILFSNAFIRWLGKRNTVIIGMLTTVIGGMIPFFINNFSLIVFSRLLVGAGIGLFTSLAVSLIGDCFSGDEQKTLIGIQGAMGTLGNSSCTFISGLLLGINWQSTFLYMLIIIPFLILFMMGYTRKMEVATTVKEVHKINDRSKSKVKIPVRIYVAFLMLFLFFAAFMVEATGSALVIQENQLANQGVLSTEIAIAGLIGAVISMGYSKIYKLLHSFTPVVSTIGGIIGFIICSSASNMVIFFIGLIFMMIACLIIPYVYDTILSDVDSSISNLIISIAQVCNNLGAFASPFVISFISKMMNAATPVDQMRISAGILTVITIVFLGIALTGQHAKKQVSI